MDSKVSIRKLTSIEEMLANFKLIKELTAALTIEEYASLLHIMIPNNYLQVVIHDGDKCIAVSGYWICAKLYSGKYMEIDNFIVLDEDRSKGIGKLLIDWLTNEAKANECQVIMLDAYVENFKAHRFYYREGFIARGFHYLKHLT